MKDGMIDSWLRLKVEKSGLKVVKKIMLSSTEHEIPSAYKNIMLKNNDFSCFQTLRWCIYHVNKC